MSSNFVQFELQIKQCLLRFDVNYFINDLQDLFNDEVVKSMYDSEQSYRSVVFITEFKKIINPDKYRRLMVSAKEHNNWIYLFLSVDLANRPEIKDLEAKWIVLENLLELLRRSRNALCVMNFELISALYSKEVITKSMQDYLKKCLDNFGEETTLLELFSVVSLRQSNWYSTFLYLTARQNTAFMEFINDHLEIDASEPISEDSYKVYAENMMSKVISQYHHENSIGEDAHSEYHQQNSIEDAHSDYGSEDRSIDGDQSLDIFDELIVEEEIQHEDLQLKAFQLELAQVALSGQNVIVYAPTGTGKTVVAIHVANKHLEKNPAGKIAFLVPRTPLVTQQYRAFEKFKDPQYEVIEMRAKGDSVIGPLIAHIDSYQVFVMTSDILRNALTIDDGNKLSSICQFSLIFFDECHNCMKQHPYTKIMKEYFKEKRDHPDKKLPQIVGLTASPRSNKKDDIIGMQKSLFELCANLDCRAFSMVKEHVAELEDEMNQPKQDVIKIAKRHFDEFEKSLVQVMTKCELKLKKMQNEFYFPAIKQLPSNKFDQDYVSFVGNLERLNTLTTSENDGKQKAYCIYRYLNAYYRGLIVNQMFGEYYARETISKHLRHNGVDFTCCYDEEFYNSYKDEITARPQSENPSIERIKSLIKTQLEDNPDSRILIFVQQVDYTYYLVDILKKNNQIDAEAIVGSNTKNNLKGCTISEMNDILVRFNKGDIKVLVATTVVEEGLDIGLCNMVISYGHVTNETALIQRRGRARSINSRYILVLPPMLAWLEKKELLNERRKDMMMDLISKFGQMNFEASNMNLFVLDYQQKNFFIDKKSSTITSENIVSWNFRCKHCQELICTSEELRIVESMHRICINPKLLTTFTIYKKEIKSFGSQGNYKIGGVIKCKCQNNDLANYMLYKNIPYFQLIISACNVESPTPMTEKEHSLKKWKDFAKYYTIQDLSKEELQQYCVQVQDLVI